LTNQAFPTQTSPHPPKSTGPPRMQHNYQPRQLDGLPRIDNRSTNETASHSTLNRLRRQSEHVRAGYAQPVNTTINIAVTKILEYKFNRVY